MRFIIWVINFTNIEENGVCNSINYITINIPKNFSSSKITIDNLKKKIGIKNMNIWECIEFEQVWVV